MKRLFPGILLSFVIIIAAVLYYRYDRGKTREILNKRKAEYPAIDIDERISAIVTHVNHGISRTIRNNPHQAYLILNGSIKRRIRTGYELDRGLMLDEVITEGLLLFKDTGNDTIFLYKIELGDTLKYSFQIRDDMGYPFISTD